MIYQASFPQEIIQEDEDPKYEATEVKTCLITDLPQEEQDRIKAIKGSRMGQFRSFKLGNKVVEK